MDERDITLSQLQERVDRHNQLADKYATQIEVLRRDAEAEADIWELLLSQMFVQSALAADHRAELPDSIQEAAVEFGLMCMGIGVILALDALNEERIAL